MSESKGTDFPPDRQTFWAHLEELRRRLIFSLVAFVAAAVACYFIRGRLFAVLTLPMTSLQKDLVVLTPTEQFSALIKVCAAGGLVLSLPVLLYQFWLFTAPGLTGRERGFVLPVLFLAPVFFLIGAGFGFFLILPLALKFLLGILPQIKVTISLERYLSFVLGILLAFGAVFELPLVITGLARLNLVTARWLRRQRKFVVPVIFFVAAVLTPGPDVFSQVLLAVPLWILYELSILIAVFIQPERRKETVNDVRR